MNSVKNRVYSEPHTSTPTNKSARYLDLDVALRQLLWVAESLRLHLRAALRRLLCAMPNWHDRIQPFSQRTSLKSAYGRAVGTRRCHV